MRLSFLTFVLVVLTFAFSIPAQTSLTARAFEKGIQKAKAKQFDEAIKDFHQALLFSDAEKPGDKQLAKIHFNVGVCLFNLKQTRDAVAEFTEAIKLSRRSYQKAFYALGMAQSELENWQAAETAFREAVKLKKDDGEAWFDLGLVLIETENYDRAKAAFKKAIEFGSIDRAHAHNNLGVIFALRADFPAAEAEFKTALTESNGKSIEARNNLEFCRLYKQNFNQNTLAKFEFSRKNKQGE
jgi:Flp pilus assembly protein TadD